MIITSKFKKDFDVVAKIRYELDEVEYEEFKSIVRKMLAENKDFTIKWITESAIGWEPFDFNVGVQPIICNPESEDERKIRLDLWEKKNGK
tara:strand:- start:2886 stop:3158 length:273 start_codon:yes stop_codon:yes gene_type:complete